MMWFRSTIAAAAALTACVLLGAVSSAASAAEDQTIQGCKPDADALTYTYSTSEGGRASLRKECSGVHRFNSRGISVDPGGWSGYVFFTSGDPERFCPGDRPHGLGSRRVIGIIMN